MSDDTNPRLDFSAAAGTIPATLRWRADAALSSAQRSASDELAAYLTASNPSVAPGGVLIAENPTNAVEVSFGRLADAESAAVNLETIYDVASVTKPVVTASIILRALAAGRCRLDDRLSRWFPEYAQGDKAAVSIAHCLGHGSGLPDWRPFFQDGDVLQAVLAEPLIAPVGSVQLYSDLGYILLGAIAERLYQRPLDEIARDQLFDPLSLGCGYRRISRFRDQPIPPNIAPTERCGWRGRRPHGEVHDENAAALDGVAGHAGLFARASDLTSVGGAWLRAFKGERGLFEPELVRQLWVEAPLYGSGSRRLGWDTITPGADQSAAGHYLTTASVGHLGFTGCSIWIDPSTETIVVLLTNRVYHGRDNLTIKPFRRRVHDLVARAIGYRERRADTL
ncbi:MAG: serine hydrolase [Myxococcales bacterium]|nr:serine hydrolase [Myxococcales bacterium]